MKHPVYIPLLLFVLLALGCAKSTKPVAEDYTITGLTDIAVSQYKDTTVTALYHVVLPANYYSPVSILFETLPPGVTVSPAAFTDTTSFSFQVTYHIQMSAAATFPVTMTLYSAASGKKSFSFNIIVGPAAAFSYTLGSIHDVSVPLYTDTIIYIPVKTTYTSGISENVYIAPDALPAGISVAPLYISGTPSFTDSFAFHVAANTTGTFPVTLLATSAHTNKVSAFNVSVTAGADCARPMTGRYTSNTVCNSYSGAGTGVGSCIISEPSTNKLQISVPFANLPADLFCGTGILNSSPVTSGGIAVSGGTGTFNATTIVVNYVLSGTINSACRTTLSR